MSPEAVPASPSPCPNPAACHHGERPEGSLCQMAQTLKDGSVVCFELLAAREQLRLTGRYHDLLDERNKRADKAAAELAKNIITVGPGVFPGVRNNGRKKPF